MHMETGSSSPAFERVAGYAAIITGISSLAYAVAFLILKATGTSAFFLLLGGLLAIVVATALYEHLRAVDASFALIALLFGFAGGLGTALQGAYSLANAINPPVGVGAATAEVAATLPFQADPRGLLAFGVSGVAVLLFAWLITRGKALPTNLGYLGYVLGVLLLALYIGSLMTASDTKSLAVLIPGGLASIVANPAWYLWIGVSFLRAH
jgi:hypothetical protein